MNTYYQMCIAVRDKLAVELLGFNLPITVKRRLIIQQTDSLPEILISPADTERVEMMDMCLDATYVYPIVISLCWPENRNYSWDADAELYLDISEAIRNQIMNPNFVRGPMQMAWNTKFIGVKPFNVVDQKSTYSIKQWTVEIYNNEDRSIS